VQILRTGTAHAYRLLDCDAPAKLVLWSRGAGGAGFKQEINFQAGTSMINDGSYKLLRYQKFESLFNSHTHPTPDGTSGPPNQPAIESRDACPTVFFD
jgi:hypothetical protein